MHPLSLPSSLLAALWSSLWTFCFSQLPDLFPLLFSGGSPLPALLTRLLAALLLCLGLPLFTGLLACAALGPPRPGVGGESAPAAGLFPVYASRGSGISFPPDFFKFLLTAKNQYDIFLISNRSTRRTVYDGNYFIQ